MSVPSVKLNTGASMPAIGLGAAPVHWTPEGKAETKNWVLTALQAGYRHVDTGHFYGTEAAVGAALRASGIPREEVFVTTKLPWHHAKCVARSFDESLKNLGFDYVDLYLMHYPQAVTYPAYDDGYSAPSSLAEIVGPGMVVDDSHTFNETWAEMEKIHASGRARAIGVCSFSVKTLEKLLETAKIVPAAIEVECSPYLVETQLLDYCRQKGIALTIYSPTGGPLGEAVRTDPTIVALAEKYGVSAVQIILAWHVARGTVALPSTDNVAWQKENITLPALTVEDVSTITALDRNQRFTNKPGPDGKLFGWTTEQYGWD
ncbi:NADP-dependent oxidoreductase domain-containing protein [Mycena sp. CBHHK59/15]|nr:NADP-dependent oxidoreductase domain-containing protein [Mycena sp. CBHHK59/15]